MNEATATLPTATYADIRLEIIVPSPDNPRKKFDPAALKELAANIKANGMIEPIVVRPIRIASDGPDGPTVCDNYEIVAGERRFRAAKSLGLATVSVKIMQLSDAAALEIMLSENLQRKDMHALDEGVGFAKLIEKRNGTGPDVEGMATRLGVSARYIYDRLRLAKLNASARKLFQADAFPIGHAIMLSRLSSADQDRALDTDKGGVFLRQRLLGEVADEALAPASAAALKNWIDQNVRLDLEAKDTAELFPDLTHAVERSTLRVVHVTFLNQVSPEVLGEGKILGPKTWKPADPECPHSALGVVVIGPRTGESLKVCYDRKRCATHWAAEQRDARLKAAERGQADPEASTKAESSPSWLVKSREDRAEQERRERDERDIECAETAKLVISEALSKIATAQKFVHPTLVAVVSEHNYTFDAMAYIGGYPAHSKKALDKLSIQDLVRVMIVSDLMAESLDGGIQPGFDRPAGGLTRLLQSIAVALSIDVKKVRKEVHANRLKQKALDEQAKKLAAMPPAPAKPKPKAKAKPAAKKRGRK